MGISNLEEALRKARPTSDEQRYVIIHLPAQAITTAAIVAEFSEPFLAVIADAHEVTLVVPAGSWDALQRRLPEARISPDWRLITFDAVLDHNLTGFLAAISARLADAGVALFAISAYERDHVLVRSDQFDSAWTALTAG